MYFLVDPSPEWKANGGETFELSTGFRAMQDHLWYTFSTPQCHHDGLSRGPRATNNTSGRAIKLGPDATVVLGLPTATEASIPEKIIVYLTVGQSAIRWLAVMNAVSTRLSSKGWREVMLRTEHCCEECALDHVAAQPGKWILIL
jgi:hypothetical protein